MGKNMFFQCRGQRADGHMCAHVHRFGDCSVGVWLGYWLSILGLRRSRCCSLFDRLTQTVYTSSED